MSSNLTLNERVIAAVGYINILFLVPLLLKPKSDYARHHGLQGAVLFIAWVVIWILAIVPILGGIIFLVGSILIVVLAILGVIYAYSGEKWEMPILGAYAKRINWK